MHSYVLGREQPIMSRRTLRTIRWDIALASRYLHTCAIPPQYIVASWPNLPCWYCIGALKFISTYLSIYLSIYLSVYLSIYCVKNILSLCWQIGTFVQTQINSGIVSIFASMPVSLCVSLTLDTPPPFFPPHHQPKGNEADPPLVMLQCTNRNQNITQLQVPILCA